MWQFIAMLCYVFAAIVFRGTMQVVCIAGAAFMFGVLCERYSKKDMK